MRVPSRTVGSTGLALSELGFGAAPLGNLYRAMSDVDASETLGRALAAGISYVDTAPYYGFGLSERRVGDGVRDTRGIVVSTKVGRLLRPVPGLYGSAERYGFHSPLPFEPRFDYTYDGVMRSWEASLQRLGLASVDILYVHDIGRLVHGEWHSAHLAELTSGGGFRALDELRWGGAIKAFGIGVNEIDVCLEVMQYTRLDLILLAGRYTLLEQDALDELLPMCERCDTSIVIGGPYNSGILATGTRRGAALHYNYGPAPQAIVERVQRIETCCESHDVPLAAAALRFPLAHPRIVSVIPGLSNPYQVDETLKLYRTQIPADFWSELKMRRLLRQDAPVP